MGGTVRAWLADRPVLASLAVLLAPVAICVAGLGFMAALPALQGAGAGAGEHGPAADSQALMSPIVPTLPTLSPQELIPLGRAPVRVPILEYHYIRVNPDPRDTLGFNLSVTPANFSAQMDWLQGSGFHPIDLNDLRAYLLGKQTLPPRPVVLTFDDGYIDFYTTAFPVLRAHGFTAVSYVVPGFLQHDRYMTSGDVVAIDRAGVEVAAHTMTHADLTKTSPAQLALQVQGSRTALEQLLGHPVLDFCYPSGQFNATVIAELQRAGFQSATTERPGIEHSWGDRLTWARVRVNGGEKLEQFVASLGEPELTTAG